MSRLGAIALLWLALGCSSPKTVASPPPIQPQPGELDLGGLVARTRVAFRPTEGRLQARGGSHRVELEPDGRIQFTPISDWLRKDQPTLSLRRVSLHAGGRAPTATTNRAAFAMADCVLEVVNREDAVDVQWRVPQRPGAGSWTLEYELTGMSLKDSTAAGIEFQDEMRRTGALIGPATWIDATGRRTPVEMTFSDRLRLVVPEAVLASSQFPALLDPTMTPVRDVDAPSWVPNGGATDIAASFDGANHLVAWTDLQQELLAARVSPQGTLIDSTPIPVALGASRVAAAFGAGQHLLAMVRGQNIEVAQVSPAGVVSPRTLVQNVTQNILQLDVAFSNGVFLVAWVANGTVYAARVSGAGAVLGSTLSVTAAGGDALGVAGVNGTFLVAFGATANVLKAVRIDSTGAVLDATPPTLGSATFAAVASSGSEFLVGWVDNLTVRAMRVTPGGVLKDPGGLVVSFELGPGFSSLGPLAASSDGSEFRLSWGAYVSQVSSIRTARIALDAGILDLNGTDLVRPEPASVLSNSPVVDGTLVAWANPMAIRGLRAASDGGVLDAKPFLIRVKNNREANPHVASNGSLFQVVWGDDRGGIFGARIAFDGGVLDDPGFEIIAGANLHGVVSNGSDFLVTGTPSDPPLRTVAARVSSDGVVLDVPPLLVSSVQHPHSVSGSFNGDYLVAVQGVGIRLTRVLADGGLPDPPEGVPIFPGASGQSSPAIGTTDAGYVVTWTDFANGPSVHGARVAPDLTNPDDGGMLLLPGCNCEVRLVSARGELTLVTASAAYRLAADLSSISPPSPGLRFPVAFDGEYFLSVDKDNLHRFSPSMGLVGSMSLNPPQCYSPGPNVASDGVSQRSAIVSGCQTATSERVQFRIVDTRAGPGGTPCAIAADCLNGLCADGVCCDTGCTSDGGPDCLACSTAKGAATNGICGPAVFGTVCRDVVGLCDVRDLCDGVAPECPADAVAVAGAECAPGSMCRAADHCDGVGPACQHHGYFDAGTPCDDNQACTLMDACNLGGQCSYAGEKDCNTPYNPCLHTAFCDWTTGNCPQRVARADGILCPLDGGATGECRTGVCSQLDAGTGDAGLADGGADAGIVDGGASDSGAADAGAIDAGPNASDAGPDAGGAGGGGGSGNGGGQGGAGGGLSLPDAGIGPVATTGCGCSTGPDFALLAMLGVGFAFARRRFLDGYPSC